MNFLIDRDDNSTFIKTRNGVTKVDGIRLGWLVMGLFFVSMFFNLYSLIISKLRNLS